MDDLISRSDLMAQVVRKMSEVGAKRYTEGFNDAILRVRSMIHSAKAINAVPVVRCKDCKYMRERHYEGPGEPPYIKRICESKYGLSKPYTVEEWDFCSRGERKDGGVGCSTR